MGELLYNKLETTVYEFIKKHCHAYTRTSDTTWDFFPRFYDFNMMPTREKSLKDWYNNIFHIYDTIENTYKFLCSWYSGNIFACFKVCQMNALLFFSINSTIFLSPKNFSIPEEYRVLIISALEVLVFACILPIFWARSHLFCCSDSVWKWERERESRKREKLWRFLVEYKIRTKTF